MKYKKTERRKVLSYIERKVINAFILQFFCSVRLNFYTLHTCGIRLSERFDEPIDSKPLSESI